MADIETSIVIDAPISDVFNHVVADWEGSLDFWPRGIKRWKPKGNTRLGDGFRVRCVALMLGIPIPVEMEVSEFSRDQGWIARSVGGPLVEGRWHFASEQNQTRFSYRLRYRMPPPVFGPLVDRWLFEPAWRRAISDALDNLKKAVEAGTHGRLV